MSTSLHGVTIGAMVEFKGPIGSFEWLGSGNLKWKGVQKHVKSLGLICGGSGMYR